MTSLPLRTKRRSTRQPLPVMRSPGADAIIDDRMIWLSQLATSLAHELGNPLQSIRGCIDLSLEDQALSPASREYLGLACAEIERLSALIIRLREFYDTNAPERASVDFEAFLDSADSVQK